LAGIDLIRCIHNLVVNSFLRGHPWVWLCACASVNWCTWTKCNVCASRCVE